MHFLTGSVVYSVDAAKTTPASANHVYANTARGVYVSSDRGQTWEHRAAGLRERYGRAIAVHPRNPIFRIHGMSLSRL